MSEQELQESLQLQRSLDKLAECEREMSVADRDVEIFRLKRTHKVFEVRKEILKNISNFWYIVLAENDDFAEYVSVEDLKYLEAIENMYVEYKISSIEEPSEEDLKHFKDFSVTISFTGGSGDGSVPKQSVTKHFQTIIEDGEEKIISKSVDVQWPQELESINPQAIKLQNKGKVLTKEHRANYRLGMKSFFSWFSWTGEKPGKEFRNGEDLTRLIIDDLYLNALKYYVLALPNNDESEESDEEDSSEGEELDLDDEDMNDRKRGLEDDESENKRQK